MWKHFCVSSCEIVGTFFSLFGAFPSLWSQPDCLLGRELMRHVTDETNAFSFLF